GWSRLVRHLDRGDAPEHDRLGVAGTVAGSARRAAVLGETAAVGRGRGHVAGRWKEVDVIAEPARRGGRRERTDHHHCEKKITGQAHVSSSFRHSGTIARRNDSAIGYLSKFSPSSRDRFVAASTAFISVVRTPPFSSVCRPVMAVPPGEVT